MAKEIERKFLVNGNGWKQNAQGITFRQGYLNSNKFRTVRIRSMGEKAVLTVKGITEGVKRTEFEYEIPLTDCNFMLDTLAEKPLVEKTRYRIAYEGFVWEIDEFHGENEGLVVAEIELPAENTVFRKPLWIGKEVSDDPRYFNSALVDNPYKKWKTSETY